MSSNQPDRRLLDEIEQNERWLAEQGLERVGPPNLERVKRAVTTALHEQWFEQVHHEPFSPTALAAAKQGVRTELAKTFSRRQSGGSWPRRWASLAAAACLMIGAGLSVWFSQPPTSDRSQTDFAIMTLDQALSDYAELFGVGELVVELDAELDDLADDLEAFSQPFWMTEGLMTEAESTG